MTGRQPHAAALRCLEKVLEPDAVVTDPDQLTSLAHDIAGPAEVDPVAAAIPRSVEELSAVVGAATRSGLNIVPRGGGMSYSGGYTPSEPNCILIDTRRLAAVQQINVVDRYVVVEAGCTWRTLHEALAGSGFRTPFFGPLSGRVSTVAGATSQNAAFFGSAAHGSMDGTVIGLEVVLPDGRILHTGVLRPGGVDGQPHGPDLSHLFVGDCGTFGVKARLVLRLVPAPGGEAFVSVGFDDPSAMLAAQTALAGRQGIGECFGFDQKSHQNILDRRHSFRQKAGAIATIAVQSGGIARAARLSVDKLAFLEDVAYSLHLSVEGDNTNHAETRSNRILRELAERGGRELPDVIPRITRTRPFGPITALLGPQGENWLPVHGVLSLSAVEACYRDLQAMMADRSAEMAEVGVVATILTVLSGRALILEPQFFWPDCLSPFHLNHVTAEQVRNHKDSPADFEARALVHALRKTAIEIFHRNAACHMQIGRIYPFGSRLTETQGEIIALIRSTIDPEGRLNPGVLRSD
ncbi:MAG: FAD-binding oxidoreductase [Rhodospirillaceae bacterium]|nr:FAD-binding oxidoreductase [Rhodospirillaceae bacterium]